MKKSYTRYIIIGMFVLFVLIGCIFYIRHDSQQQIGEHYYKQWTKYYIKKTKDGAYVDTQPQLKEGVSLSEGHGYGMLICVLAARDGQRTQNLFNQMNHYYLAHRYDKTQLMSWRQTIQKGHVKQEKNNATDGDLYIAYALIEAAKQWPRQKKEYLLEANHILSDILRYNYNPNQKILTVGNWATKDTKYYNMMRTSDVVPILFDVFYHETKDKRWLDIKNSMLDSLQTLSQQHQTGLVPDFALVHSNSVHPVSNDFVSSKYDGDYYYNACRVPYNLALSHDKRAQQILNKIMHFFMKQNKIKGGYYLNGKAIDPHASGVFGAPLFFAAIQYPKVYDKLFQQEKFLLMRSLPKANYYEAVFITMIALQIQEHDF